MLPASKHPNPAGSSRVRGRSSAAQWLDAATQRIPRLHLECSRTRFWTNAISKTICGAGEQSVGVANMGLLTRPASFVGVQTLAQGEGGRQGARMRRRPSSNGDMSKSGIELSQTKADERHAECFGTANDAASVKFSRSSLKPMCCLQRSNRIPVILVLPFHGVNVHERMGAA